MSEVLKHSLTCDLWLSCWLMARRSSSCCRSSTRASCFSQTSFSSIFMESSISCFIPICTSSSFSTSCTEIGFNSRGALCRLWSTCPVCFQAYTSISYKSSERSMLRAWNTPIEEKFPLWAACVFRPALVRLTVSRFLMPEKVKYKTVTNLIHPSISSTCVGYCNSLQYAGQQIGH